ncbi:MAG: hypothetical protein ACXWNX_13470, partial [Isosphaeraceae bacterium]
MFSGKLDGLETAEPRQEMGCGDAPDRLSRILVRWVLTPLAGLWCGFLLVTWLPTYLTWPWYTDSEHFAMLARLWDSGGLPYRDMFSTQFPGEIYLHWLLGKLLGWGNTVAYYAVDAALVIAFGALLVLWGRRRVGSALPGWIGFSTFLLYYVSQNYTVAGQRDWHAAFLVLFCLLLPGIGSAPAFRVFSAVAFGLALVVRPQVILLLPAVVLALDASTRAPGEPWRKTFSALFWWVVVVGVVAGLGFLPLVASGIGGDFLACLKALAQPPYNKVGPSELLIRLSPQKHPLVLVAVAALVGLLWDQTGGSDRRMGCTVLAAIVGVLFYPVISPFRHLYHVIPQVAVAALGVTYLVIQVLPRGHQPTRLIVAALVLSFLFFGASAKPLSFKALRPGTETYGLSTAWRVLRAGEMPPLPPLGYFSTYPWADHRALMEYLRQNTATGTPVANLLIYHTSAVTSEIPRRSPLPVDSNCLYMYPIPALVRREIEALKAAPDSCVVLWDPSSLEARAAEFSELIETVRRFYQFEARFGAFEVWRRRPGTTESVFVPRPQISAPRTSASAPNALPRGFASWGNSSTEGPSYRKLVQVLSHDEPD